MPTLPPCYGIIPARYASTRFPGKPLADILGRPMFWHVHQRAMGCPLLGKVVLATDDRRIHDAALRFGVPVVMTRADHASGTDRVLEAAQRLSLPEEAVVVNIQGDEPLLDPKMLTRLLEPFADPGVQVATLAAKISAAEAARPDRVKVVFTRSGNALYFSRSVIPHDRDATGGDCWGHVGLYAFRMPALRRFVALGQSGLERREKLEQLRLLENDIPIYVVPTEHETLGVDRPEDLDTIIARMTETPR
jgi:3-deoxy-manno-octulosonate cytidylyltransferase (CMP-KDO synthetase)